MSPMIVSPHIKIAYKITKVFVTTCYLQNQYHIDHTLYIIQCIYIHIYIYIYIHHIYVAQNNNIRETQPTCLNETWCTTTKWVLVQSSLTQFGRSLVNWGSHHALWEHVFLCPEHATTNFRKLSEAATLCGEMATTQRLSNSAQYWERMLFGQGSNNHCRLQSTNSIIHILHICKGWIQPVCGLQILQFLIFQFEPKNGVLEIILPQKTLRAGASKFQQTSAPLFGSALKRVSSSTWLQNQGIRWAKTNVIIQGLNKISLTCSYA